MVKYMQTILIVSLSRHLFKHDKELIIFKCNATLCSIMKFVKTNIQIGQIHDYTLDLCSFIVVCVCVFFFFCYYGQ